MNFAFSLSLLLLSTPVIASGFTKPDYEKLLSRVHTNKVVLAGVVSNNLYFSGPCDGTGEIIKESLNDDAASIKFTYTLNCQLRAQGKTEKVQYSGTSEIKIESSSTFIKTPSLPEPSGSWNSLSINPVLQYTDIQQDDHRSYLLTFQNKGFKYSISDLLKEFSFSGTGFEP